MGRFRRWRSRRRAVKARLDNIRTLGPTRKTSIIVAVAVAALLSTQIGFVNLVSFLYPLYGYMGILIFVGMLINFFRPKVGTFKNTEKSQSQ